MQVYRLANKKYIKDLSGTGAALYGGRWNKKGTPVLYTSENEALALLEFIVNTPPMIIPDPDLLVIEIPDDAIEPINRYELPNNWKAYPAPYALAAMGEKWIKSGESLALKVPSCIVPRQFNYLLNPRHPKASAIKIINQRPFEFDPRLKNRE